MWSSNKSCCTNWERGREIPEFIHYNLNNNLENTVILQQLDESVLMRKYGAFTAMAIAEFFRDKGHDVLWWWIQLQDLLMAQREIGLSTGEPPVSRGYPPSVLHFSSINGKSRK